MKIIRRTFLALIFIFIFLLLSCKNNNIASDKLSDYYSWSNDLKREEIIRIEIETKSLGTGPNTEINRIVSENEIDINYNFNLLNSNVYKKIFEAIDGGSSKKLVFYTTSNSYEIEFINGYFKTNNDFSYYILEDIKIEHPQG